jgi:hypothetical protein
LTLTIARAVIIAAVFTFASSAVATARATPAPGTAASASPTPNPLTYKGFFRSYYFTRQNATGNAGTQKQVNQATWNSAIDLHADYNFAGGGWYVGGSYFYANPLDGPCAVANAHAKGQPCVSQKSPNTNPDDSLPGFALSTFPEAYLGFKGYDVAGKIGDQLFTSPWAASYDGARLKPAAYQGADVAYAFGDGWTAEAADMIQFENRTSATFNSNTLLTSFPAGAGGMAANIYVPGGSGLRTGGFFYGKLGYAPKGSNYAVNGYYYGVSSLLDIWWFDGKYTLDADRRKPFVALQGGFESNAGASDLGKIASSDIGIQMGASVMKNVVLTLGFDAIPWRNDSIDLPPGVTCNNGTYQISTKGTTLAYFLPGNGGSSGQAGVCFTNANGKTSIYYGGWASPYTDSYAADPFFTTQFSQGMADRRAPGTSWKAAATFTSNNKRFVFIASDGWYNYGNALIAQNSNEWNLDGQYRFSPMTTARYKGLLLRYRYAQRSQSSTSLLGGLPLFKYNRAQLQYDF